jgi:hypothetical protein
MRLVVQSAFIFFSISGLCGCSLIDFGIGAVIDGGKPDKDTLAVGTAMNLESGDEIRISLVESTVVEGIYKETVPLDSATYAQRYTRFLSDKGRDSTFPRLGDTLCITKQVSCSPAICFVASELRV